MKQHGFTLLELLIAMTLLALLMGVLYGSLNTAIQGWTRGGERLEMINTLRLTEDFLRTRLRQSRTVYRNDVASGQQQVYFSGEAEQLTWVTPMLAHLGLGGLYVLELDWPEYHYLRLRWFPYRPGDGLEDVVIDPDHIGDTVLLEQVDEFRIRYYGTRDNDQEPQWHDAWDSIQQRPQLVSLQITLAGQVWPTLTVALQD